jgi:tetratricopeptide (TPR) repeat protein
MKLNEQALKDFTRLTDLAEESNQQSPALSKAYFYKAKALKKMGNLSDSILYFEQVVRANDDNHLASQALYEIAKIKIQQKDFYEAYYNLKRAAHFKLKQRKLVNYQMFTEGVIFLMKRKTKTGVKLISSLIERMKPGQS